ncbi:MAG: energy transducer TonB [Bdellovibrionota bacterium]
MRRFLLPMYFLTVIASCTTGQKISDLSDQPGLEKAAPSLTGSKVPGNGVSYITYNIDETGNSTNVELDPSKPRSVFDQEAIKVIKNWKYKPTIVNGVPIQVKNKQAKIFFTLRNEK